MAERLFKVLGDGRMPYHGGEGAWPEAGVWREAEGPLVLCENGLHLCREQDLVSWLGPEIWEAECEGERLDGDDKIVVRRARLTRKLETWTERTARLFACDCAERVLPIYEKRYPDDKRPREAIAVVRRYADGKATKKELAAARAALEAAWAALEAALEAAWAALEAARAAAWAALETARAVAWAAWAALEAAGAVAWAAWAALEAAGAAWAAERKWQTARLMHYLYGEDAT